MIIKMTFQANIKYEIRERILKDAAANHCKIDVKDIDDHITSMTISATKGSVEFNIPEVVPPEEEESTEPTPEAAPSQPPKAKAKSSKKPKIPKAPKT